MESAAINLQRKIQEHHHIPIYQARIWFSQLLSAVAYLHQQDIGHRDLKCENVLLTADDQIKLADFGLARLYRSSDNLSDLFCCTSSYAAPEVLMRRPYDPKKSDVWSLGVILYVMVPGELPFIASDQKNLPILQRQSLVYPGNITVEEPCCAFISYLLQFNPSNRPSVAEVAEHPWLRSSETNETGSSSLAMAESSAGHVFGASNNVYKESTEDEGSNAGSSINGVKKEDSCFICIPVCPAVKRAAKAYVVAPILRASHSLQGRLQKFLRKNSEDVVHNSSSSQQGAHHTASTETPAGLSSKGVTPNLPLCGLVVEEEPVLPQSTVKQRTRRLKFPKFKILKRSTKVHYLCPLKSTASSNDDVLAEVKLPLRGSVVEAESVLPQSTEKQKSGG